MLFIVKLKKQVQILVHYKQMYNMSRSLYKIWKNLLNINFLY